MTPPATTPPAPAEIRRIALIDTSIFLWRFFRRGTADAPSFTVPAPGSIAPVVPGEEMSSGTTSSRGRANFESPDTRSCQRDSFLESVRRWFPFLAEPPDDTLVAFALDGCRHRDRRHRIDPGYKAQRTARPAALARLFDAAPGWLNEAGHVTLGADELEADDVIATAAAWAAQAGIGIDVYTGDRDLAQALNRPDDRWIDPGGERGTTRETMSERDCTRRLRASVKRIPEILALAGDRADNIPGVPGLGKRLAARLLAQHGDLDALLDACHRIDAIAPHKRRNGSAARRFAQLAHLLVQHEERIRLNQALTRLDAAHPTVLEQCQRAFSPRPLKSRSMGEHAHA